MIYLKLAWRNLRRSLRDYALYLCTLVLSVVVFYSFNSLTDQPVLLELFRQAGMQPAIQPAVLGVVSVLAAAIVAVMVLYSHQFIIRKRQRELGTYLLLGMNHHTVARLLFIETLATGAVACVAGIVAGVLFSGAFSAALGAVMGVAVRGPLLILSPFALLATLVLCALVFGGVAVFSAAAIARQPLVKLLNAQRRNQELRVRGPLPTAILGAGALLLLVAAYALALQVGGSGGLDPRNPRLTLAALLAVAGTFGFYYSSIGLGIGLLRRTEASQRGLSPFTMRQIVRKVNANTLALTATCLLLAMTVVSLAGMLGFRNLIDQAGRETVPYTYAVQYLAPDTPLAALDAVANSEPGNPLLARLTLTTRWTPFLLSSLTRPGAAAETPLRTRAVGRRCSAIGVTDYNQLRKAAGQEPIVLQGDEFALDILDYQQLYRQKIDSALAQGVTVTLQGVVYHGTQTYASSIGERFLPGGNTLVLPDRALGGLDGTGARVAVLYRFGHDDPGMRLRLAQAVRELGSGVLVVEAQERAGLRLIEMMLVFIGLYLDVVLLLACAAVLGLQQLTEVIETVPAYRMLQHLGASDRQIEHSLFTQAVFYFAAPVAPAAAHSLAAGWVLQRSINLFAGLAPAAALVPLGMLALLYGAYLAITWWSCRGIVRTVLRAPLPAV